MDKLKSDHLLPCYNLDMNIQNPIHTVATERDMSGQDATKRDVSRQEFEMPMPNSVPAIEGSTFHQGSITPNDTVATTNDASRQVATERDTSGQLATRRDETRQSPAEVLGEEQPKSASIEASDSAEAATDEWLDIEETQKVLISHGISRTPRSLQRICKKGQLKCHLVPTETGTRYLVTVTSIKDFVKRHNEKMPSGDGPDIADATTRTPTIPPSQKGDLEVTPRSTDAENQLEVDPISGDATHTYHSGHAREIISLKDEQIALLQSQLGTANHQLQVKDEQISTMQEREHETNVLIQNLQRLVPMLAAPDRPNTDLGSRDESGTDSWNIPPHN